MGLSLSLFCYAHISLDKSRLLLSWPFAIFQLSTLVCCLWKVRSLDSMRSCRNEWYPPLSPSLYSLPINPVRNCIEFFRLVWIVAIFFCPSLFLSIVLVVKHVNFPSIYTMLFSLPCHLIFSPQLFFFFIHFGPPPLGNIYVKEFDWIPPSSIFDFTSSSPQSWTFLWDENERKSCHLTEFMRRSWSHQSVVECQFRFLGR